jgi:WD40 repeat protein
VLPHAHRVDAAAFSPDGTLVLTNGIDGSARLWDVASGKEVRSFTHAGGRIAAFSPDGRFILTGGPEPQAVQLWDVATGASVRTFVGQAGVGVSAALSGDGRHIVTASDSAVAGNVRLWDATTGTPLHIVQNPSPVVGVALSPDGSYALTGSRDNIARLWDVATGKVVREFVGHTNILWNVAFSPDGRYVVTASVDKTARLWNVATGQQLRVFPGHANAAVGSAIVSPDGRTVAVGSFDGVTQLTDVDVDTLVQSVCARVLRDFTADERAVYSIKDATPTCVDP